MKIKISFYIFNHKFSNDVVNSAIAMNLFFG